MTIKIGPKYQTVSEHTTSPDLVSLQAEVISRQTDGWMEQDKTKDRKGWDRPTDRHNVAHL
jgi:hypothetical protein